MFNFKSNTNFMKPSIYIIIIIGFSTFLNSCGKDFLSRDTGVLMPIEKVFSDSLLASEYADNSYNYLINDYLRFGMSGGSQAVSGTSQVCDETVESVFTSSPIRPLIKVNLIAHVKRIVRVFNETIKK